SPSLATGDSPLPHRSSLIAVKVSARNPSSTASSPSQAPTHGNCAVVPTGETAAAPRPKAPKRRIIRNMRFDWKCLRGRPVLEDRSWETVEKPHHAEV